MKSNSTRFGYKTISMRLDSNTAQAIHLLDVLGNRYVRYARACTLRLMGQTSFLNTCSILGIAHAHIATRSRLRAAGIVSESFHDVQQFQYFYSRGWKVLLPCTTTCASHLQCHAECTFQYTLLEERKGTITKRNCSLSTSDASLSPYVGWSCSFDYAVNEAAVDADMDAFSRLERIQVATISVILAILAVADVAMLFRMNRTVADAYMAATSSARREEIRTKHEKLLDLLFRTTVVSIMGGFCGAAALRGMTFQSFLDVDNLFIPLLAVSSLLSFVTQFVNCLVLVLFTAFLRDQ